MDSSIWLVVVLAVVILVVVVVVTVYGAQKRRKDMRALAEQMGYQYVEQELDPAGLLSGFGLFGRGHSRRATNVLTTETGGNRVTFMDYRWESGYGKQRRIEVQSVLHLASEGFDLPAFALRPERLGQKIAGLMGQQDIDFEDHPDFSAAYVLQGSDEPRVRALFNRETRAFLAGRPGLSVEGQGGRLLYYRVRKTVSPDAVPAFIKDGLTLLGLLVKAAPRPAAADPLAGLDSVLADLGVQDGAGGE